MEDKIIEVFKKYSKSVDTEYNVYNCLIEEDWSNIAQELVKLFCQPAVMRSVLADLRSQLERSRQLTQSFDDGEARWRDGMESGLETAIELLEDALTKHFS